MQSLANSTLHGPVQQHLHFPVPMSDSLTPKRPLSPHISKVCFWSVLPNSYKFILWILEICPQKKTGGNEFSQRKIQTIRLLEASCPALIACVKISSMASGKKHPGGNNRLYLDRSFTFGETSRYMYLYNLVEINFNKVNG